MKQSLQNINGGGGLVNAGYVTTFNEYAIVSENRLTCLPKGYSTELASLNGCSVTTGLSVIEINTQLLMGESIVVVGVGAGAGAGGGGVGLNIIQGALLHSGHPIVTIDRYDKHMILENKLRAIHTLNNQITLDWVTDVRSFVGKSGADVVVDNTGNP